MTNSNGGMLCTDTKPLVLVWQLQGLHVFQNYNAFHYVNLLESLFDYKNIEGGMLSRGDILWNRYVIHVA